jgi:hypothetical protein
MQMTAKRFLMASVLAVCLSGVALAQPYTPVAPYEGGINPRPEISSTSIANNRVRVNWNGFLGPYKLWRSSNSWATSNLVTSVSSTARQMTYLCPSSVPTNSEFKVTGPTPKYASAYGRCSTCHSQIARDWVKTPHAEAFDSLIAYGEDENTNCLACHTVGYGLSTGYTDAKPYMADVQCENCHGPVGGHAGKFSTPAVTLDATMCGGCHESSDPQNHSTFTEWEEAGHAEVNADFTGATSGFNSNSIAYAQGRMSTCGFCHSGAERKHLRSGRLAWCATTRTMSTRRTVGFTCGTR